MKDIRELDSSKVKKGHTSSRTISFLGIPMHAWTMEQTVQEISRRLDKNIFTQHVVVNVAKLVNMQKNLALCEAVLGCDIINIDGMGIVWGARILGKNVPERVSGIDLFLRLLELASERGEKVYLLGAKKDVIEKAVDNLQHDFPNLKIAGWHHGYFWDNEEMVVNEIASSGAKMLFIAISSPQKEEFMHKWRGKLGVKFAMGVGGTFDIVAGKTKRAPEWMQRIGLEWFFRLIQEPRRMWKRYLITNCLFLWYLFKEAIPIGKQNL